MSKRIIGLHKKSKNHSDNTARRFVAAPVRLQDTKFRVLKKVFYPLAMQRRQLIVAKQVTELVRLSQPRIKQRYVINFLALIY
jgi:hypothetical protein